MTLLSGNTFRVYYETETTGGQMKANPALKFLGNATIGRPSPKPKHAKIKASGEKDFIKIHQMSKEPQVTFSLNPADVAFLNSVLDDKYFSLVFYDATNSKYIQFLGAKIDTLEQIAKIDDSVVWNIDAKAFTTNLNAPTLGSGSFGAASSVVLDYSKIELRKAGSVISDWLEVSFQINNQLRIRKNPSTKAIRAIETVSRVNTWSYVRDMDTSDAFDEYQNIIDDTSFALKVKLTNDAGSSAFAVTFNNAKYDDIDPNVLEAEDLIGKRLVGSGTTLTYSTS